MPKRSKKNPYRAVSVKGVDIERLPLDSQGQVVAAIDVAKKAMKAALLDADGRHLATVKWDHPVETPEFGGLLRKLGRRVDAVAESTGTYGTALMELLRSDGHGVFMVSTKRSHDAAEVFDGVPSQHDSKDAHVLGMLHLSGCSSPWPKRSVEQRNLEAQVRLLYATQERYQQAKSRLEALLAVYWPGVTDVLELGSPNLWALVERLCWSGAVHQQEALARRIIREVGRGCLRLPKIEEVLENARSAGGVEPTEGEESELRALISTLRQEKKALREHRDRLARLGEGIKSVRHMTPLLGVVTATVLTAEAGNPGDYDSSGAFLKALGLNLRERSSGKHRGQLKITKRGPGKARFYAYLATLRLIQDDAVAQAWYQRKVARDGGKSKKKAVIAVTRKLMRALPHVARGEIFDATKLFDVGRLNLGVAKAA